MTEDIVSKFQLVPFWQSAAPQIVVRIVSVSAAVAWIVIAVGRITGQISSPAATFFSAGVLVTLAVVAWRSWVESRGAVFIEQDGVIVRTGSGTHSYPWDDIAAVRVTTLSQTGRLSRALALILHLNSASELLEITLRRHTRVSLVPFRTGTRTVGVPKFLSRVIHLQVVGPRDCLAATQRHLVGG
jgi:hypothetical protein